jgi:hypothetical protein
MASVTAPVRETKVDTASASALEFQIDDLLTEHASGAVPLTACNGCNGCGAFDDETFQ